MGEQGVMVFSRQGCPWCDRLLPVLRNNILRRLDSSSAPPMGAGHNLLSTPLRVFVYDAEEFAPIMERFRIEGFPTILFFGQPGVRPRLIPGYRDEDTFAKLLAEIATAKPEPAEPADNRK